MTVRTRTTAISLLCVAFVILGALFVFWPQITRMAQEPVYLAPAAMDMPACYDEVKEERDLEKVVRVGQRYFDGGQEYDLTCARIAYNRAIALDPQGYTASWYQLGRIDFIEGKFDDALFKFGKQIEFFGDTMPNVYYVRGLVYGYRARETGHTEDWQRAEQDFRRYIEIDPEVPWPRVDLAWVLFSQGKYEEMKPVLEEGLLVAPEQPWLLNMYGLALLNTGDAEGGRLFFESALYLAKKLTPEDWGNAYPGNDPAVWSAGLAEMVSSIEKNLALARG